MRRVSLTLTVAVTAVLTGCSDIDDQLGPSSPDASARQNVEGGAADNVALPRFPELLEHVPAVQIRDPGAASEPLSDPHLVAAIEGSDGQVIIGIKPPGAARTHETGVVPGIDRATALAARGTLTSRGVEITRTFRHISAVVGVIDPDDAPELRRLPVVDYVEPVPVGQVAVSQQDTAWGVQIIGAPNVWDGINRGWYASVTILDTGIDSIHRFAHDGDGPANMGTHCYYVAGLDSCYDDYHFDPGHGTLVAGTIAGRNNAYGYVGVAHDPARFASVKVCDQVHCKEDWVLSGLDWVLGSGWPRHVVNISIGFCTETTALEQTLQSAYNYGILVVAAAGNTSPPCSSESDLAHHADPVTGVQWPARYATTLAVSGTYEDDSFASGPGHPYHPEWCQAGSRYGPEIELAAPFWVTTMARSTSTPAYDMICGTSFSAPHVTAAAALIWSNNTQLSAVQVRSHVKGSAVKYSPASQFGEGRLDVWNALAPKPPPSYSASIAGPEEVKPDVLCSWTGTSDSPDGPLSFEWYVDQQLIGTGSVVYYSTPSSFTLELQVTDAQENTMYDFLEVSTDPWAGGCNAQ